MFTDAPPILEAANCLMGFWLGAGYGALVVLAFRKRGAACTVAAVQRERWRIARELHDTVGHRLVVISMQVRALHVGTSRAQLVADAVEEEARAAQREIRRTIGVLRGLGTGGDALSTSVADLAARVPTDQLTVRMDSVDAEHQVRPEVRQAALRIVQEGVTNALKHGSGPIQVALAFGAELRIDVTNGLLTGDGEPGPMTARGGYGLLGLRERIAAFGGSLACGPVQGGGFVLRARIPRDGKSNRSNTGSRRGRNWSPDRR